MESLSSRFLREKGRSNLLMCLNSKEDSALLTDVHMFPLNGVFTAAAAFPGPMIEESPVCSVVLSQVDIGVRLPG